MRGGRKLGRRIAVTTVCPFPGVDNEVDRSEEGDDEGLSLSGSDGADEGDDHLDPHLEYADGWLCNDTPRAEVRGASTHWGQGAGGVVMVGPLRLLPDGELRMANGCAIDEPAAEEAPATAMAVDEESAVVARRSVPIMRGVDGVRGAALLFAQYPAVSLVGDGTAPLQIPHRAELHSDASFARQIVGNPRASDLSVPGSDATRPGGGGCKRGVPPELLKELAVLLDGAETRKIAETTFLARHGRVVSRTQLQLKVTEIGVRERRGTAQDKAAKRQRVRWFVNSTVRAQLGLPAAPPTVPVPDDGKSVKTTAIPRTAGMESTRAPTRADEPAGGTMGEPFCGIAEAVRRLEQLLSVVASASRRQERTLQCLTEQVARLVTASHHDATAGDSDEATGGSEGLSVVPSVVVATGSTPALLDLSRPWSSVELSPPPSSGDSPPADEG